MAAPAIAFDHICETLSSCGFWHIQPPWHTSCISNPTSGAVHLIASATWQPEKEDDMLTWALAFFVLALIAGVLGFGGIAGAAAGIAKVLFLIFLVLLVISAIAAAFRGRPPI